MKTALFLNLLNFSFETPFSKTHIFYQKKLVNNLFFIKKRQISQRDIKQFLRKILGINGTGGFYVL